MSDLQTRTQIQPSPKPQSHPDFSTFWKIGAVLFVITAIEFLILNLEGMQDFVTAVLFALSALKFYLVASYFMHLKWDKRLLGWIFGVGVALAFVITIALKFVSYA